MKKMTESEFESWRRSIDGRIVTSSVIVSHGKVQYTIPFRRTSEGIVVPSRRDSVGFQYLDKNSPKLPSWDVFEEGLHLLPEE